jgi:CHAT domain-containing protein/tetratricopeptide (TPR) repeat protein
MGKLGAGPVSDVSAEHDPGGGDTSPRRNVPRSTRRARATADAAAAHIAIAEQALALRNTEPAQARSLVEALLAAQPSTTSGELESRAIAFRVLALLELDDGNSDLARHHALRAVALVKRIPVGPVREGVLVTASGVLMFGGRVRQSLACIDQAAAESSIPVGFDLAYQRAWVLARAGRSQEAVVLAGELAARADLTEMDRADAAGLHATLLLERGAYAQALAAVQRTIDFYEPGRPTMDLNYAYNNKALVLAALGDLPGALQVLDQCQLSAVSLGSRVHTWTIVARAWTCLWGNLHDEAFAAAEEAWALARNSDLETRAECGLTLVRSALASGRVDRAVEVAKLTRPMKARIGHQSEARICQLVQLQQAAATPAGLRRLSATAHLVGSGTHPNQVTEAHFGAFEAALRLGETAIAESHWRALHAHRPTMPALEQSRVWLADSMWHVHRGASHQAGRAVSAGLGVLRRHRSALGSTELRIAASHSGAALAGIGLRLAIDRGSGKDILIASEAWRAQGSLRRSPPGDDVVAALDELRGVVVRSRLGDVDEQTRHRLLKQQVELEATVRRLTRNTRATKHEVAADLEDALNALGDRTLVSYVAVDDQLAALVVREGRVRVKRLAATVTAVLAEQGRLAFSLRRLSRAAAPPAIIRSATEAAERSIAALRAQVVAPLARLGVSGSGGGIIVVAPAALHAVPWAALVDSHGSSTASGTADAVCLTVVPSALQLARSGERSSGAMVFCSGPGLVAADAEVVRSAGRYPGAVVIGEHSATDVCAALDGARLAHLACHGRLRADNPMFSALELHGGPLTVYDLERLSATPDTVVLAACDSGVGSVRPGDELLGFTTALFAGGTRSVIASVIPVPDVATASLMDAFHRGVVSGLAPAHALASARAAVGDESSHGFVTSIAFGAFGIR